MTLPSPAEIEAAMSPDGGHSKEVLAQWGVPWPPPRHWRKKLEAAWKAEQWNSKLNLSEGMRLRDEGIAQVAKNSPDFMDAGLDAIVGFDFVETTGDVIRVRLENRGITPHHVNAWGALIRSAIAKKLLIPTGKIRKSRSPKNHAHKYETYTKGQGL